MTPRRPYGRTHMEHTTSADGTTIAFDRLGDGPPLVVVGGIFCTRQTTAPLAEALASEYTVLNVDRRGRGDSGAIAPYAVDREVEDLAAVIAAAGGEAALYGHSSGAALALEAAAAGLPLTRLVLHEPPYGDDEGAPEAAAMAADILAALDADRPADAIRRFFQDMGMPSELLDDMASDPAMLEVAPTMAHDIAVMGESDGGTIPEAKARSIAVPTLLLAGSESVPFFRTTAERLAALIPDATYEVLDGADHGAPPDLVAPAVARFLRA